MSLVAAFDDLVRCTTVLTQGCESEFLQFVRNQEQCRQRWLAAEMESGGMRERLVKLQAEKDALETKLKHARNQVDIEMKRRMKAEGEKDTLERQVALVRELLDDKQRSMLDEKGRESLAALASATNLKSPAKRLSAIDESNGSILSASDISYDRTDDDLDADISVLRNGSEWKRHSHGGKKRPSAPPKEDDSPAAKTIRTDIDNVGVGETSIITTTTVTLDGEGRGTATAKIETHPKARLNRSFSQPLPITLDKRPDTPDSDSTDSFWGTPASTLKGGISTPQLTPSRVQGVLKPTTGGGRPHMFCSKTVIKPETCLPCNKKIKFGKMALKCKDCRVVCHPDCKFKVTMPCVPSNTPTSGKKQTNKYMYNHASSLQLELENFLPPYGPMIPALVVHCINEIESRGMLEEGLYRVPGSEPAIKDLREKFFQGKTPNMAKEDIHVVCGCLKSFLRGLREPLVTFNLHPNFMRATEISDEQDFATSLYQAVSEMPQPNRDTLAFIILHLQRVSESKRTKMGMSNLAKVFGPTLVGHGCPDPDHMTMLADTRKQPRVMEGLLLMPSDFWRRFAEEDNENLASPAVGNVITNPYSMRTPEGRQEDGANDRKTKENAENAAPKGSMLGPVRTPNSTDTHVKKSGSTSSLDRAKGFLQRTPLTPRFGSKSAKSTSKRNFFASPMLK
ncbi:PREDICTED: rac GTPase-activating protein 1-like isoform X3 [Branchiostoma belcheri]|uniref:Rac GTPase-activating protein 1 n=1 Tax=Branchiostoma belcheri TaxID=7741 RepID=A0A6P4ZM52_BRABE|nr:PREDICTED: rac GTPase-activating protein 1-like isoform X3 [Branchiostoma belcheri]